MELRHLRYFVAVAEELNFTRAAERLGISQPPLSLQIRLLEREVGTPLLRRLSRGVELTDAGKLMLEEAHGILRQVERAKTDVRRRARGDTGRVNIGSVGETYFYPLIPAILREYGVSYPEIVLAPEANNTSLLTSRLRLGHIDIAFIWGPISDGDGLTTYLLADEDTVMILPAGHALSNAPSAPLAALAKEPFVLFPRPLNPSSYDSIIAACHRGGFDPVLGPEAPQVVSVIPMVAARLGVSILPRSMARILFEGVIYVPIEGDRPRAEILLAHRRNERSQAVKNFAAVARRVAQNARPSGSGNVARQGEKSDVAVA